MSKQPIFTGSGVAIVTPFTENNEVNYPLLGELIDFQIENGTDAIIILSLIHISEPTRH